MLSGSIAKRSSSAGKKPSRLAAKLALAGPLCDLKKLAVGQEHGAAHGRRWLPEDNIARFRNRLRGLRDRWRAGTATRADVEARVSAWIAHADHADTFWLRQAMFEDGWFEPVPELYT